MARPLLLVPKKLHGCSRHAHIALGQRMLAPLLFLRVMGADSWSMLEETLTSPWHDVEPVCSTDRAASLLQVRSARAASEQELTEKASHAAASSKRRKKKKFLKRKAAKAVTKSRIAKIIKDREVSHVQTEASYGPGGIAMAYMPRRPPQVALQTQYGKGISGTIAGQETSLGSSVALDENGYRQVLALKSNSEMETFLRRTVQGLGLQVTDDQGLLQMVPAYSGDAGSASFGDFKGKVLNMLGQPNAWVVDPIHPVASTSDNSGKKKLYAEEEVVPTTEEGYAAVAAQRSNAEMSFFIEQVVKHLGLRVVNSGGIQGLAPYYSGDRMVQSLAALEGEITKAAQTPGAWVAAG